MLKFPYHYNDTLKYISKYAKKYNLNYEQVEKAKEQLIPYYKKIDINKEELIFNFKQSFYTDNNKYYTKALEYVENDECSKILDEVIYEMLDENEFRVIYDCINELYCL